MRSSLVVVLAWLCLTVGVAAGESTAEDGPQYLRLQAGLGYHYSTGKYDDSKATEISYVPLVVHGEIDAWTIELTLPFLQIRGPAGIFGVVAGTPTDGPPADETDESVKRKEGLGDILLSGSYTLWPWWDYMPFLTGGGRIKFPTASRNKGLGTGEFDFYFFGQAVWSTHGFTPFLELGYELLSDFHLNGSQASDMQSTKVDLKDAVRVSGGASYDILDDLAMGLSLDYGSPTSDNIGDRIDLVPFLNWMIFDSWLVGAYVDAGLASGSPDVGVGVQITCRLFEAGT